MIYRLLTVLALTFTALPVFAASPVLSGISPVGAQRGTEAVVLFNGARLADAQEVFVYYPGISVKKLDVVNANQLKITFNITPDCRLGEHLFRVRTASGITDARSFWVGALPIVDEKEPNSDYTAPQAIALNSTVHGSIGGEDVDYFVVECKKGQRLSVEVEAMRLAVGFWDPYVAILNDKRFEIATSDDAPTIGQDSGCSVMIPADGSYTVMIRESAYGSGSAYRMHIGNFPRPTAVIPAGGKPGEEIEFRFIGDPSGEIKQKIKLPTVFDDHFRIHAQTADGICPTGFKARVADLSNVIENAANITPAAAVAGTFPCAYHGIISKAGETKYFKFAGTKGQVIDIRCYARQLGSPLDSVMYVADANKHQLGAVRASNDDSGSPDSYFRFSVPETKEYYVYLHDHLKKGGPDYFFRIEMSAPVAHTTTNIPRVNGNNSADQDRQNITVPKGGRYATMINVIRTNWGGAATLSFPNLPAGIVPVFDPVEPGMNSIPVVFESKGEAPVPGTLAPIVAMPADAKVIAKPETALDVFYNIGLNNTPFHKITVDRIAIAATEEAPYSIEVIEPKAGVPQNGSMNLKVVAKRNGTFKGPITVSPLFTPPGMGIQGSAVIPEGATEVLMPMNAAPNAAARKWKTAIRAVADAGQGPVWTSSQLFTLEVIPPMVTFAQERTAVEQGQNTAVFSKITVNTPFVGEAIVRLIGLPAKVATTELKITKDSKELSFPITTDKSSPAGKHNTFCQVIITHNGEQVVHSVGGGELRIDVPIPPKVAPTPMPTTPKPMTPPPPMTTAPKRLTRLEQLRLEQEEREKAAKAGTPMPTPPKKEEPKK